MSEEYGNNKVLSRDCQIVKSIVEGVAYNDPPRSEEEYWLLKLKDMLEDENRVESENHGNRTALSRDCQILKSMVEGMTYEHLPKSEEEYWLLKLKEVIESSILKDFPGLPASIVTVTDALAKPLDSLKVAITPVQSGSGDPSPDNIRPISGWTGAKITKTAKNLFGSDRWFGIGGTDNIEERTVTGGAQATSIPFLSNLGGYTFKENTIYTLIVTMTSTATNGRPCFSFVYTDGTSEQLKNNNIGTTKGSYAFSSNPNKTIDYIGRASYSGTKKYYVDECGVFEGALTADDFEPYTGQTYPITFPSEAGTVYGGTLDVTNGVLRVTYIKKTYSGSSSDVQEMISYQRFLMKAPNCKSVSSGTPPIKCNILKPHVRTSVEGGNYRISIWSSSTLVFHITSSITSIELLDEWLAENNVEVVYPLATPKTYQLTPTEVQMLLGTNNIWADTGDILEGKYWGKRSSATRAMLNTLRDAREVTEITEPEESEEPEENADER